MKIQLDTDSKIIKLESDVKLSRLIETLEKLLPKGEWKQFTLETNTVIHNWKTPYVFREIDIQPVPYYPTYPWYWNNPTPVLCQSNPAFNFVGTNSTQMIGGDAALTKGVFNVEV